MQKYQDVVLNQNGNPISGAEITVTDLLGTPVPVYASNGVGVNVNPVRSDADGRFFFYAPDGRYNLVVRFGGNIMATVTDILLEDPQDGSDAVFNDVTVLGEVTGNVTGNAGTVTNGVYTTGDQTIGGTKTFTGNVLVTSNTGGLGYGTGAGGTVTQATSKSTAVTLNRPVGNIVMHNEPLAAGASVTFALQNSVIAASDLLLVCLASLGGAYRAECIGVAVGGATIRVTNVSGGSLSEAPTIRFAVIKGATS